MIKTETNVIAALSIGAPQDGESLQRWLYNSIRQSILDGRIPANAVLPGTRSLAIEYRLSRGTIQAAYNQLISEGYLETQKGSGTRVTSTLPDIALKVVPTITKSDSSFEKTPLAPSGPWAAFLQETEPAFPLTRRTNTLPPFSPHRSDVNEFPIDIWRKLHVRHLRPSKLHALLDTDVAGLPALRTAIAQHLGIARGVSVTADNIIVFSSVQQALDICMRVCVNVKEKVWMEDPGYPGARQIMLAAGANVVDIGIDQDGMRVEDGVSEAPDARLAYVTPARQSPTGISLSPERRLTLLQWANNNNSYIFEDDYDSEYRFIAKPIPALKSLPGADDCVVLAGTFSKLLFPGIRLAFVVPPVHLLQYFIRAASLTYRNANGLSQAVLADFMIEGHLDRHVRRMRRIYNSRAEALCNAARKYWTGLIDLQAPQAGLDVVGYLINIDEAAATHKLLSIGITVFPLKKYRGSKSGAPGLVIGFAPFDEKIIDQAAMKMGIVLKELQI